MSSSRTWLVVAAKRVQKVIERAPKRDQESLREALAGMQFDPFHGDVKRLKNQPTAFRRRVGDWRLLFDVDLAHRLVEVRYVERRTSTTYRQRK